MATRLLTPTFAATIVALLIPPGVMRAISPPAADEFVGTTPCDAQARRFVGIAASTPCERITWRLALSGGSSTYTMTAAFGMQMSGGPGLMDGGGTAQLRGSWSALQGTNTDPNAVVYRLTDEASGRSATFAKIGDNLIHLLNDDRSLAVGNASWSYTLNRTPSVRGVVAGGQPAADTSMAKRAAGVYEGRTPCHELVRDLGVSAPDDCSKLKWRLTLLQDAATGAATTYTLEGTLYRSHPLTGTWTIVTDARTKRIVYRLSMERPATSLSFIKADDNILFFLDSAGAYRVGNDAFSYTMNRSADAR